MPAQPPGGVTVAVGEQAASGRFGQQQPQRLRPGVVGDQIQIPDRGELRWIFGQPLPPAILVVEIVVGTGGIGLGDDGEPPADADRAQRRGRIALRDLRVEGAERRILDQHLGQRAAGSSSSSAGRSSPVVSGSSSAPSQVGSVVPAGR
ncbi:hypothetical protein [Nocardia africana]|uniref:Uncharacterized protein n=1 Tax=Nocardia africana TaxID=134964 RepID=A0A378WK65_9NOCA|nr:hypothetical protein [Nocardia africana]SUA41648.1 Uncharacterised protein [Nocardia africana]